MIKKTIKNFFALEAATGVLLLIATGLALLVANSGYNQFYQDFFAGDFSISLGLFDLHKELTIRDWVNDALMAVFFLLVGLELKKEVLVGELSSKAKITLPLIAAFGGIFFPAAIFLYFNIHDPENLRGFAIPTATDIAFAYGIISLFGKRFSFSSKIFLVALAVIDDLVAILIIAVFYTRHIDALYLILSSLVLFGLFLLNAKKSSNILAYIFLGILLWLMILKSGIHATIAGVLLALFFPLKIGNKHFLESFAKKISPFVNFLILPIFAFANAGVKIDPTSFDILQDHLILGIALGLFIGKQLGVLISSFIAVKIGVSSLPRGTNWPEFYAIAIFTGIGFTMSLFIGSLAFGSNYMLSEVKIGVLLGSFVSIFYGLIVALFATRKNYEK